MTLDAAGARLSEIAGEPLRPHSTQDFGREPYAEARSVVVPKTRSREVLEEMRRELGPSLIAFIGTTRWLGDERHDEAEEIVVAKGDSQFDILRVAQSDAVNYGKETEDLIRKLTEYDRAYGIDIFHAETDTIEFRLTRLPDDLRRFSRDLYEFCPDIVDQGVETVEALEQEIRRTGEVYLWWD
jgi:hypothetical protein